MIVVDASVAIKWIVDVPLHPEARHIYKYQLDIQAPDFILIEVPNVAWKKAQREEIESEQVFEIIKLAVKAIPRFIHSPDILAQAAKLAIELAHPIYDCLYLACIDERHDALVTADKRFFNKIKDTRFGNRIRFLDDPDLALPLYISLHKIDEIIKLSELIGDTRRNFISALKDENEFVSYKPSELQPLFDSPAYRRLNSEIEKLSAVEQADILALGWLGRGYDGGDWAPIRERAETAIKGSDKRFLPYVGGMAIYLEQGLAVLRPPP